MLQKKLPYANDFPYLFTLEARSKEGASKNIAIDYSPAYCE